MWRTTHTSSSPAWCVPREGEWMVGEGERGSGARERELEREGGGWLAELLLEPTRRAQPKYCVHVWYQHAAWPRERLGAATRSVRIQLGCGGGRVRPVISRCPSAVPCSPTSPLQWGSLTPLFYFFHYPPLLLAPSAVLAQPSAAAGRRAHNLGRVGRRRDQKEGRRD